MSKKCVAFSKSKLGLETADNRKSFYAGWDAALADLAGQEPVAWMYVNNDGECEQIEYITNEAIPNDPSVTPLYAAPVRTKDLTDDEIAEIVTELDSKLIMRDATELEIARAVIAADRSKNGIV